MANSIGGVDHRLVGDGVFVDRVRRIPWVAYVSVVVENRAAYDVTAALTIRGRNAHVTRILPPTGIYAGHSQTEVVRVSPIDASYPDPVTGWHGYAS
ncbi:MAG: hypothetical protein ABFE01_20040 [Phycisphaerales bacterium]